MRNANNMRAAVVFSILLGGLLLGCGSEPWEATAAKRAMAEQAVYESLLANLAPSLKPPLFLASATEHEWFEQNPFEEDAWYEYLDDLGGIPIDLVEELYRVNRNPVPIALKLTHADVELLPADYARTSAGSGGEERCLVGADQANIGIRAQSGRYFRAYFTVSRVALSGDLRWALLKYSFHCAPLSGGGEFFLAFKNDGQQWQVIGGRILLIS